MATSSLSSSQQQIIADSNCSHKHNIGSITNTTENTVDMTRNSTTPFHKTIDGYHDLPSMFLRPDFLREKICFLGARIMEKIWRKFPQTCKENHILRQLLGQPTYQQELRKNNLVCIFPPAWIDVLDGLVYLEEPMIDLHHYFKDMPVEKKSGLVNLLQVACASWPLILPHLNHIIPIFLDFDEMGRRMPIPLVLWPWAIHQVVVDALDHFYLSTFSTFNSPVYKEFMDFRLFPTEEKIVTIETLMRNLFATVEKQKQSVYVVVVINNIDLAVAAGLDRLSVQRLCEESNKNIKCVFY